MVRTGGVNRRLGNSDDDVEPPPASFGPAIAIDNENCVRPGRLGPVTQNPTIWKTTEEEHS